MRKATVIDSLEHTPVGTRLDVIEQLLESIRHDVKIGKGDGNSRKPVFKVKQFALGGEVLCDRDEMYRERG